MSDNDGVLHAMAHQKRRHTYETRSFPAPLVGTDFKIVVGNGEDWRLLTITATLVCSAVVASRDPKLTVDDQTNLVAVYPSILLPAASSNTRYCWIAGYPTTMAAAEAGLEVVPIVEHFLPTGYRVGPVTGALDAGDQWSNVTATFEKVNEPAHLNLMVGTQADDDYDAMRAAMEGR